MAVILFGHLFIPFRQIDLAILFDIYYIHVILLYTPSY